MPKQLKAINSMNQTLHLNIDFGISKIVKLTSIPTAQTRKIIFLFFLLFVGLSEPFVNWNQELYANIAKNNTAATL